MLLQRLQLFLGLEVDTAKALPVGSETGELAIDLRQRWQRCAGLCFGDIETPLRRDPERIADPGHLLAPALANGFELCLAAGACLTLGANGRLCSAERLGSPALCVLRLGKPVSCGLAFCFGLAQHIQELVPLVLDDRRQSRQFVEFRLCRLEAGLQGADLLLGARSALGPALAFGGSFRPALGAHLPFALNASECCADVRGSVACRFCLLLCFGEQGLVITACADLGKTGFDRDKPHAGLCQASFRTSLGVSDGAEAAFRVAG